MDIKTIKKNGNSYFGGSTAVSKVSSMPLLTIWDIGLIFDFPILVVVNIIFFTKIFEGTMMITVKRMND